MACWTASAKWAEGPALDGQRDMPLTLSLTEWLGITVANARCVCELVFCPGVEFGLRLSQQLLQIGSKVCHWFALHSKLLLPISFLPLILGCT